jgi:hypothetical protein
MAGKKKKFDTSFDFGANVDRKGKRKAPPRKKTRKSNRFSQAGGS